MRRLHFARRTFRGAIVAACVATLAAVFSPISPGIPQAHAATCEVGGELHWGVKESFRNYISGRIAKGEYAARDGAVDAGSHFVFPVSGSRVISQAQGEVDFDGTLTFYGHKGSLDITLTDFGLNINGSTAELTADFTTRKFTGFNPGVIGEEQTGDDAVIVTVQLDSPADFYGSEISLNGITTLGDGGRVLFGDFYDANERLDNTGGALTVTGCDASSVGKGGSGGNKGGDRGQTDSGATTGVAGLLGGLNDTLVEVNGLFVNTDNVITNGEILYNRSAPGSASTKGTRGTAKSTTSQASQTASTSKTSGGSQNSGANSNNYAGSRTSGNNTGGNASTKAPTSAGTSGNSGGGGNTGGGGSLAQAARGAAGLAPAVTDDLCSAESSRGIVSSQAQWGVRTSFRSYIRGTIANGGWNLTGVSFNNDTFNFTGTSGAVDPATKTGTIMYPGTINFYGHGGILDTTFSNMEIQFSGNSGQLIVDAQSNSVEGIPKDYGRVALADLSFSSLDVNDSSASGQAQAYLTEAGADAFGQFYPVGDALDPISFDAQLGGPPSCVEGQGTAASQAGSGSSADKEAAAKLRAGGVGANGSAGAPGDKPGAKNDPANPDNAHLAHSESSEEGDGEDKGGLFRIKNSASGEGDEGLWSDANIARLLMIIASLGVGAFSTMRSLRVF